MPRSSAGNDPVSRAEFFAFLKSQERRFEQMDRRFEQMDRRFDQMVSELRAQRHWTEVVVGGFQRRAGRNLEEMVAGCLRVALDMADIRKEALQMRRRFVDRHGEIGPAGREYEIDLYASDGHAFLFEVKSVSDEEDVQRFADKAGLAARLWSLPKARKVLVTLDKSREVSQACRRAGVILA